MKRIIMVVFLALAALNTSTIAKAADSKKENTVVNTNASGASQITAAEAQQMANRVYEIQKMDKSDLTATQKKVLKSELSTIKERVKKDPVVFAVSGAGLVLIIILLLLLL